MRRRNLKATIIQNRENHQVIMLVILAENHFEELIVQDYQRLMKVDNLQAEARFLV